MCAVHPKLIYSIHSKIINHIELSTGAQVLIIAITPKTRELVLGDKATQ